MREDSRTTAVLVLSLVWGAVGRCGLIMLRLNEVNVDMSSGYGILYKGRFPSFEFASNL